MKPEPHRRDGDEECAQEKDVLSDVSGLRVVTDGANCGSIRLVAVHLAVKQDVVQKMQPLTNMFSLQSALKTAAEAAMASSDSALRRPETALDHGYSAAVAGVIADAMLAHRRGRRVS